MHNTLYDTLKKISVERKSTRVFSAKNVSDELVDKIIEIANCSPYASSRKNWSIEIINDPSLIKKASHAVDLRAEYLKMNIRNDFRESFGTYTKNFSFFGDAPVLLIPNFRVSSTISSLLSFHDESILTWERDNFIKSISCVSMLILLAAESLGLGACYVTGALIAQKELIEIFNIRNGREIGSIIPIGFKKEVTSEC